MLKDDVYVLKCYKEFIDRIRYEDGELYFVYSMHKNRVGQRVGFICGEGYRKAHITGLGSRGCHKIIYLMHHGRLPLIIDHIDGNRQNNKIENLREATNQQNMCNAKLYATNKSGHRGIYLRVSGKWTAEIRLHGKTIVLGSFEALEDAIAARRQAEEKYYGEFARDTGRYNELGK